MTTNNNRERYGMSTTHAGADMPEPKPPTLLVDTDCVLSLDPWEADAKARRWFELFSHIPDAEPRNGGLLDVLELAQEDGIRIGYTSRWPMLTLQLIRDWIEEHGYPEGYVQTRRSPRISPADLAAIHAGEATRGRSGVLVVHADEAVTAELRSRSIAALTPAQLPQTVEGLRRVFDLAKPAPRLLKPRPKQRETGSVAS
jgi:hypothetical protein